MFVYLIEASNGMIKIGIAENLRGRLRQIEAHSPIPVVVKAFIECESIEQAKRIEKVIHTRYKNARDHNEWFSIPVEIALSLFVNLGGVECAIKYQSSRSRSFRMIEEPKMTAPSDNGSVMDVAMLWLKKHGMTGTIRQMADSAGVSRATMFRAKRNYDKES